MFGPTLTAADAEAYEDVVVPRYLSFFGSLIVDMLIPGSPSALAHIGCRTGYPDAILADKMPGCSITGVDSSSAALDLARARMAAVSNVHASYEIAEAIPTGLPSEAFTHSFAMHPFAGAEGRVELLGELRRVLMPGGQALLSLPLRGSFPEINDMIREFALRQDLADLGKAVDAASSSRPTIETIAEEFEGAGLTEVDVDVQLIAVSFNNGREFLEDPITKLMVFPDLAAVLPLDRELAAPCLRYVHDAISKYWSEGVFELTVNVGCASGRKL
jgi:SAM-dependent methyltransferase